MIHDKTSPSLGWFSLLVYLPFSSGQCQYTKCIVWPVTALLKVRLWSGLATASTLFLQFIFNRIRAGRWWWRWQLELQETLQNTSSNHPASLVILDGSRLEAGDENYRSSSSVLSVLSASSLWKITSSIQFYSKSDPPLLWPWNLYDMIPLLIGRSS